jgi:hypothetical protein
MSASGAKQPFVGIDKVLPGFGDQCFASWLSELFGVAYGAALCD